MKIVKWVLYIAGYLLVLISAPLLSTSIMPDTICWKEPIAGPIAAVLIVLYSFAAAPEHKKYAALGGYFFGVFLACKIPDIHWYPECHPAAYQSTPLPIMLTCVSGLVALLVVWAYSTKKRYKLLRPPTNASAGVKR
jgi:uncharacterized membrane protein